MNNEIWTVHLWPKRTVWPPSPTIRELPGGQFASIHFLRDVSNSLRKACWDCSRRGASCGMAWLHFWICIKLGNFQLYANVRGANPRGSQLCFASTSDQMAMEHSLIIAVSAYPQLYDPSLPSRAEMLPGGRLPKLSVSPVGIIHILIM